MKYRKKTAALFLVLLAWAMVMPPSAWAQDEAVLEHRRGLALAKSQQHAQAVSAFTRALEMRPGFPEALNNRGMSYLAMNKFKKAEQDFIHATEVAPGYFQAWNNLAMARYKMGNHFQALLDTKQALRINPSFGMPYLTQGLVYMETDLHYLALKAFDRVIQMDPSYARGFFHRGLANLELNNLDQAMQDIETAMTMDRNNPSFYQARARIHIASGNTQCALEDLNRSLALWPTSFQTLSLRARLYFEGEDYSAAKADLNRALEIIPEDSGLLMILEDIMTRQGDFPQDIVQGEAGDLELNLTVQNIHQVFSNEELGLSRFFFDCIEQSDEIMEIRSCIQEEITRQDERLNKAYEELMAILSPARKKKIEAAQNDWMRYREAKSILYLDPQGGARAFLIHDHFYLSTTSARARGLEVLTELEKFSQ